MIYHIAGLQVEMFPQYSHLQAQCQAYRVWPSETAAASILNSAATTAPDSAATTAPDSAATTAPDSAATTAPDSAAMSAPDSGTKPIPELVIPQDPLFSLSSQASVSDIDLAQQEYIFCGASFCRQIVSHGRFFLHASAVVCNQGAYLFAGPSGTGKSTHTALWRELFPDSYILNDDKPVIWPGPEEITVWGTPFSGKSNLQRNTSAPLKGICFLRQGAENKIRRISGAEAVAGILNNTWRPHQPQQMEQLLDMLEQVTARVPMYQLICTAKPEAARIASEAMLAKSTQI